MSLNDLIIGALVTGGLSTSLCTFLGYITYKEAFYNRREQRRFDIISNEKKYKKEIEEYNKKVKEYCDNIKKLNLDDIELFIKLIYDLWENIDGYCTQAKVITGFERLHLSKYNWGCCRHFADDMEAKLNYINPKYNARQIFVHLDNENYGYILPIETKIFKREDSIQNENLVREDCNKWVNHVVLAVDLNKYITLMIDPTNVQIGYIKGKKIKLFGSAKTNYKYNRRYAYIVDSKLGKLSDKLTKLTPSKKIERLYGKEVQEQALDHVKYIDGDIEKVAQKALK